LKTVLPKKVGGTRYYTAFTPLAADPIGCPTCFVLSISVASATGTCIFHNTSMLRFRVWCAWKPFCANRALQ